MTGSLKILSGAALATSLAFVPASLAEQITPAAKSIMMTPGKALVQQIGDVHSVSYFQPGEDVCGLTVVIASSKTGAAADDPHGTRIVVPVPAGKAMLIDGTNKQTAEFVCGPKGQKMSTHVYDRETYKAAKS